MRGKGSLHLWFSCFSLSLSVSQTTVAGGHCLSCLASSLPPSGSGKLFGDLPTTLDLFLHPRQQIWKACPAGASYKLKQTLMAQPNGVSLLHLAKMSTECHWALWFPQRPFNLLDFLYVCFSDMFRLWISKIQTIHKIHKYTSTGRTSRQP